MRNRSIIIFGILVLAVLVVVLMTERVPLKDRHYKVKSAFTLPNLTNEDVSRAIDDPELNGFLLHFHINGGGYYDYHGYILNDLLAIARISVRTDTEREYFTDVMDSSVPSADLEYAKQILEDAPDGNYLAFYEIPLSREFVNEFLLKISESELIEDGEDHTLPGHGLLFGVSLWLDGKGALCNGEFYVTQDPEHPTERNWEMLEYVRYTIVPYFEENGTEISWDEFTEIKNSHLAGYDFATLLEF